MHIQLVVIYWDPERLCPMLDMVELHDGVDCSLYHVPEA
jgi:hypothetical protein